jgi:elongation factor 1 alpha-like protein
VPKVQSIGSGIDQQQFDMASLNLQNSPDVFEEEEPPKMTLAREKVLQQAREALQGDSKGKRGISLVVIGM